MQNYKIVTAAKAADIAKALQNQQKRIVLAGGCFDILHTGHIDFLKKAKEQGDILIILLESDAMAKKKKGKNRPLNTQSDRADVLSELISIDYIVLLPEQMADSDYEKMTYTLKPAIIATTKGDTGRMYKERQALHIGATVIDVTPRIENQSTSRVTKLLAREFDL